ncbi:MAG: LCP family protein [Candidatus Saccharimonadaceae bacterium]
MSDVKKKTTASKKPVAKKLTQKPKASVSRAHGLRGFLLKHTTAVRRTATITAVLLGLSYVLAVYSAFTTSFIPGKYIGIGFLVSFAVTAALVYVLIKQTVRLKYLGIVFALAVAGLFINLGIFTAGVVANSFIDSLQESATSYEEYNIVALKKDAIKLDTKGQTISVLQADSTDDVKKAIVAETPASVIASASPTESLLALQGGQSQMALYTTAYMRELQSLTNNDVYQQLEILATIRVQVVNKTAKADVTKPFAIYLSGIDTYGDVSKTSRSDVNIIIAVNPKNHKILLVNTPRDYYVQLHGTTGVKDKLTHAGLYGIDTSVSTLEDLYGIDINYNVRINFTSLVKVVDAIGGVDVNSEYNFSADGNHFVLGQNHLDGKQALAFSRERHSFEGGDRTRGQNQMKVITGIINKMSQPSMALKAGGILSALSSVIQTNMPTSDTNTIIRDQLDSMAKWSVTSTSVDGAGASLPTYSMGAQKLYVMIPNEASLQSAKSQLETYL